MIRKFVYGLMVLGLLSLAVDWTMAGYWPIGLVLLVLTPLSLFLVKRRFLPTLSLVLALTVCMAAFGLWRAINLSLALLSVFCALAGWDLDGFSRRLSLASPEDNPASIAWQHLLRLSLVLLLAAGVSYQALSIHYETSFEWVVILVVFAFSGIGALTAWLRNRESE
jgi:hypothetical protein